MPNDGKFNAMQIVLKGIARFQKLTLSNLEFHSLSLSSHLQEQTHVPMAFFLGLLFISLFFKSIDELRRDTFLRSFRLCRGGGISPVIDTYVVVVVVAEAIVGCCGISEAEDRLLLLPPTPAPPPDEEARDL